MDFKNLWSPEPALFPNKNKNSNNKEKNITVASIINA